jgi:hypothetical protein
MRLIGASSAGRGFAHEWSLPCSTLPYPPGRSSTATATATATRLAPNVGGARVHLSARGLSATGCAITRLGAQSN